MKTPWLSLGLAIVHFVTGLLILLVSSWFIAACAVAGINFNYMLPAVVIRALALLRIASGYAEMWFAHHHLLDNLASLRLSVFSRLKDQVSTQRGAQIDALSYQTEDVASVWMAWVGQNSGIIITLVLIQVAMPLLLPSLSLWWLGFIIFSLVLYVALLVKGLNMSANITHERSDLQLKIEQHMESASLWHMQQDICHPDTTRLSGLLRTRQKDLQRALTILTLGSCALIVVMLLTAGHNLLGQPLMMIVPMAMLSVSDWLGRSFRNQKSLFDYLQGRKILQQPSMRPSIPNRIDTKINTIELVNVRGLNVLMHRQSLHVTGAGLFLLKGSSGSGKSQLLQAIAGLVPFEGQRYINGSLSPQGLLNDCYYIEQFPFCLSDTVRNNLLVATPKSSDAQLEHVLSKVGLGYLRDLNTWVGANGRLLSGGERKRLGIARALLSDKSVLLIDEPLEALDGINQQNITHILNQLATVKGVIIASHIVPSALAVTQVNELDLAPSSETRICCSEQ